MAHASALPTTRLVLDTDIFTDWRAQRQPVKSAVNDYLRRMQSLPKVAALTVFEANVGFEKQIVKFGGLDQQNQQRRLAMEQMVLACGVLDFNQRAAIIAAYIFARLPQSQRNQHWQDVFIAATALAHGYGVATRNRQDFELISRHLPPDAPVLYLAIWKL